MERKYIFFDIDGTLLDDNPGGKILESTYRTLDKLKENGHFVAIATGRAQYMAMDAAKEAHIDCLVTDGGNGITYAKSDDYYLRIKYQNSEITEIVFTKNDPEIIGEESEDDGSLGETSDNSDTDESDASDFWSDSDSDAGSDDAGNNDEDDSDKSSSTDTKTDDTPDLSAELEYDEHDDYILDSSDSRYVKKSEVSKMSKKKLRLARNEIFARHGYIFDSADLNKYFNDKNWYIPSIKPSEWSDSLLNKYEKKNIALIKKYE